MTKRFTLTLAFLALAGCNNGGTAANDAQTAYPDTGSSSNDAGSSTHDAGSSVDAGSDAGCSSTMPHCNTCTTPATDPLNACSSYVGNCTPFDNTRVPGWPDHIPMVP
jgi:hypothetical protein